MEDFDDIAKVRQQTTAARLARAEKKLSRGKQPTTTGKFIGYDATAGIAVASPVRGRQGFVALPTPATNGNLSQGQRIAVQLNNGRGIYDAPPRS